MLLKVELFHPFQYAFVYMHHSISLFIPMWTLGCLRVLPIVDSCTEHWVHVSF